MPMVVAGCWLLVAGRWWLVAGRRSPTSQPRRRRLPQTSDQRPNQRL